MPFALSLAALGLLVAAATTDAIERRIPNGLSLGLAAVGAARIGLDLAAGAAVLAAVADVAAAALWLGAAALLPFLTATALAGGLLGVGFLGWALLSRDRAKVALPYGIAIAAGGLFVTGGALWA